VSGVEADFFAEQAGGDADANRARYNLRLSYAQCNTACRCLRRHSRSPVSQCFRIAETWREIARHRLICRASSAVRRPM
jgi:hypothetical protein